MVGLYQDPEGKHVFTMGGEQSVESREESSTTETLRRRVKELERESWRRCTTTPRIMIPRTLLLSCIDYGKLFYIDHIINFISLPEVAIIATRFFSGQWPSAVQIYKVADFQTSLYTHIKW